MSILTKTLGTALLTTTLLTAGMACDASYATQMQPQPTQTPKNFYLGISAIVADSYNTGSFVVLERSTVGVLGGVTLLREGNFEAGVEGRYSTDFSDFFNTYSYGAFIKPSYNIGAVNAYGLLGYSYESGTSRSQDGVAYGAGVDFGVSRYRAFVDYTIKDNTSDDAVTVGMLYKF